MSLRLRAQDVLRLAGWIGPVVAGLALGVAVASQAAGGGSEAQGEGTVLVFRDMVFVGSRGATTEVLLTARVARLRPEENVAHLEDVEAHVSGTGEGRLDMRCDRAEYFVDTYSRADLAPASVLRRSSDGRKIRDLEEANIDSLLALGWNRPEPFQIGRTFDRDGFGKPALPQLMNGGIQLTDRFRHEQNKK